MPQSTFKETNNTNQQDQQDGLPIFSPAGYTGIGHSRSLPILRRQNIFQF